MRCFISREYNISSDILEAIQEVLDELKIKCFDVYSSECNIDIAASVSNLISDAEIVIGIITKNSTNVLYEIGLAVGKGKAVFLLFDDAVDIPSDLYNMTHIKINDNLKENLMLPLRFFVDKKGEKPQIDYREYYKKELVTDFLSKELYLKRNQNIRENKDYIGFEKLVADLFAEIKGQYTTLKFQQTERDEGYDFAVWIDELSGKILNPIKFELKACDMSFEKIHKFVERMSGRIKSQELIILLCSGKVEKYQNVNPNILIIEFEDFLNKIEKYGLAHAIWYYRCLGAHGRSCE